MISKSSSDTTVPLIWTRFPIVELPRPDPAGDGAADRCRVSGPVTGAVPPSFVSWSNQPITFSSRRRRFHDCSDIALRDPA